MEITEQTKRELQRARAEIKAGRIHHFEKVKKELGIKVGHRKNVYDTIR
ncbi:MAG TPA: hypothetical protein VJI32_05275 [Candidatus Nanoarchaeia archaeon]|nr:hypothetical protein [Candidatus Nanoarchaeia archaeon]